MKLHLVQLVGVLDSVYQVDLRLVQLASTQLEPDTQLPLRS